MIRLQCISCGHTQNYLQSDLVEGLSCALCGSPMVLPKKEIPIIVKQDLITSMERQIKEIGHLRIWEIIERFNNVKMRLAYRKIFFEAGGITPKTEV